jgi:hypothetical protein
MRLVILHYHIFKNAGSTVEDILDHSLGERFAKLETSAGDGLISQADVVRFFDARPEVRAFSSHQIRHPLPQAPGYLFFDICFLRDPIDRIRSIYTYFRKKPNPADPMSDLANRASLGDFVAGMIRDLPLFVKNVQVNLLACAGDSDEPEPRDLDVAIERMMATSFLGVVDCFDQSVAAGAHALRRAFPELDCDRPAVNVSDGLQGTVASRTENLRQACAPDVFAELLRLNALDRQLVDRARAEVLRRFALIAQPSARPMRKPDGFFTRARGFLSLFDSEFYRRKYPDVATARMNPMFHYLRHGAAEDRKPHALFDPDYYRKTCPQAPAAGRGLLAHFLGAAASSPHPLFDCEAYPDARGMNPLVHRLRRRTGLPAGPTPAGPGVVVQFDIHDAPLTVVCFEEERAIHEDWKRWADRQSGVALVWPDASGQPQWLAEPQQLPFLQSLRLDQIRAQHITAPALSSV